MNPTLNVLQLTQGSFVSQITENLESVRYQSSESDFGKYQGRFADSNWWVR